MYLAVAYNGQFAVCVLFCCPIFELFNGEMLLIHNHKPEDRYRKLMAEG